MKGVVFSHIEVSHALLLYPYGFLRYLCIRRCGCPYLLANRSRIEAGNETFRSSCLFDENRLIYVCSASYHMVSVGVFLYLLSSSNSDKS